MKSCVRPVHDLRNNYIEIIKAMHNDIGNEFGFGLPFDMYQMANQNYGNYSIKRVLVETINGGSSYFVTEGMVTLANVQTQPNIPPQQVLQNEILFEGWKHESNSD